MTNTDNPRDTHTNNLEITLEANEFYMFASMLNDHIIESMKQCEAQGIPYHGGIAFCKELHKKLVPFMHHRVTVIREDKSP